MTKEDKSAYKRTSEYVSTFITPLNTLYLFPVVLAGLLDFLSPFGNYLWVIAALSILLVVAMVFAYKKKIPSWITKGIVVYFVIACCVLCSSAFANLGYKDKGGFLANHVPKIKTWQDAYLINIKQDTEAILAKTDTLEKKLDQNNFLLSQVMANMTAPLEKALKEEVKSYDKLARNQKDAVMYFTSKVGINGIKKYKKFSAALDAYINDPSEKTKKALQDSTRYVVEINGKRIEDEKTKLYVLALFFEPETFDYLIGNNVAPRENSSILKMFGIDARQAALGQVKDPLGDFIADLNARGIKYEEFVFIPKEQALAPSRSSKSNGSHFFGI